MSLFDDAYFGLGAVHLMHVHASSDSVTITDASGAALNPMDAVLHIEEMREEEDEYGGRHKVRTKRVTVSSQSELDWQGLASPELNAHAQIGSDLWAIEEVTAISPTFAELGLWHVRIIESTAKGYRID